MNETSSPSSPRLSRRERQMLDTVYRAGQATAAEVHSALPDPPSYSAVRATLRVLEEKGHLRHEERGPRYVYLPTVGRERARTSAVRHLVETFFEGSPAQAAAALLDMSARQLSAEDLDRLSRLVEEARKKGS